MFSGLWDLILTGVCSILFFICKWLLRFVELVEMFFNIFAGTEKILYGDEKTYLINIFFGHDAVTNAFWGMAIIAMIMSIGFTIVALARKITDVTGTAKHTIGQIVSNFIKSMLTILLLNICVVASINVANVLLERIDFALTNAAILDVETGGRPVEEAEYAAMTRILATVANYNVNKGSETRYNVNACFNAIRIDLQALQSRGFFEYEYAMTTSGHHTWQTALSYAANAADLSEDLNLNQYYPQVDDAIRLLAKELSTNPEFKPVEAGTKTVAVAPNVKVMLFLVSSFGAEHNSVYRNGSMDDALRRAYLNETKDCTDTDTVEKDFDLTEINYILLLAGSYVFLMLMLTSIIQFIERMFNLVLLYVTGPLFASSMSLDEGGKFQSWLQGFVLQLLGAFGSVFVMRIYLIIMPVMSSSALVFFPDVKGFWGTTINYMAQLILIIGGAFAVSKANSIINGALSGNSAMAAAQQQHEASAIGGALTKAGVTKAAKLGAGVAAAGVKGAAKFAFDPLGQAKKGAGAVVGGVGAAVGAVKNAFGNNQTIGAIAGAINRNRIRKMNKGITSEKSTNLNATGAKGSFEHSGGFGNRMKLESVTPERAYKSKTDEDRVVPSSVGKDGKIKQSKPKWSPDSPMAYFEGRTQMSSPYSDHRTELAENEKKEKAAKKQSSHEAPPSRRPTLSLNDDDSKGSPPIGGGIEKGNNNNDGKGTPLGVDKRNERETRTENGNQGDDKGATTKEDSTPGVKGSDVPTVSNVSQDGTKAEASTQTTPLDRANEQAQTEKADSNTQDLSTGSTNNTQDSAPSIKGSGPSIKGSGPSIKGSGPSVKGSGPSVKGSAPSIKGQVPPTGGTRTTSTAPTGGTRTTSTAPTGGTGTTSTAPTGGTGTTSTAPTGGTGTTSTAPTGGTGTTSTAPTGGTNTTSTSQGAPARRPGPSARTTNSNPMPTASKTTLGVKGSMPGPKGSMPRGKGKAPGHGGSKDAPF